MASVNKSKNHRSVAKKLALFGKHSYFCTKTDKLKLMETLQHFMAVDLGATSGRTIVGTLDPQGRLSLQELTRFANPIIKTGGRFYWDIFALYGHVVDALRKAADSNIRLTSIGIDSWGVDFALVGNDGALLRNPRCYRDPHTEGIMDAFFENVMPRETLYEKTGIQLMNINTLFQLYAMRRNGDDALGAARKLLFIPDAMAYMLTGETVCEQTIMSTSQLMNAHTRQLDPDLARAVGISPTMMGHPVRPGDIIGTLTDEVQQLSGAPAINVVAVAGHDTASAVAAVPAADNGFAYLSCGTWSLLGIETPEPIINERSLADNFTNEGGADGNTRFLKNICGLWLLEQCRKEWHDAPQSVAQLADDAMTAPALQSVINPDDPRFANPESMTRAIADYCRETNQPVPQDYRQTARCIFESLALRYKEVVERLRTYAPFPIERLHVIGGGSQNRHLMQMTADCLDMPVMAGPVEGTAIGNIMMQAKAAGRVENLQQMRQMIADNIQPKIYTPHHG